MTLQLFIDTVVSNKALECKKSGEKKTILFNLSGHGHFDMTSYDSYFSGEMKDIA